MAIAQNNQTTTSQTANGKDKKKADGYLNLKLTDKNGNVHSIQAYIPLNSEDAVHRALLNNCEDGAREFTITGYVNKAKDQSIEIEL